MPRVDEVDCKQNLERLDTGDGCLESKRDKTRVNLEDLDFGQVDVKNMSLRELTSLKVFV